MSLGKVSPPEISASAPWGDDPLSKQREGRILSNLICSLGDSAFVISLKGGWGTGKSIFLKRLGYHLENSRKVPVIKIDAWQTDYIDDPLLALTSALNERIQKTQSRSKKAANAIVTGLAESAGKIALPLISVVASTIAPGGGKAVEIAADLPELAKNFLEWDRSRKTAEESFRQNLMKAREILKKSLGSEESSPIVLMVDELDRCRPDFAIQFLERIKHFFDVPGICFLIATDHDNLPHAVKTVYGQQVDGELYLRKFFDYEFNLPRPNLVDYSKQIFQSFPGTDHTHSAEELRKTLLEQHGSKYSEYTNAYANNIAELDRAEYSIYFGIMADVSGLQLRDAMQAHTLLMAFVRSYPKTNRRFPFIDCCIACMRFKYPDEFRALVAADEHGVASVMRSNSRPLLNTIRAINVFLGVTGQTDAQDMWRALMNSAQSHESSAIDKLAYTSLMVRGFAHQRGQIPELSFTPDRYVAQVVGLTAAFTDLEDGGPGQIGA
ncbi:KAP family P-loop NTPase fold protein [Stenotrophomonas maltophilia]|uniref:KAP family P-loop NTPase fold protein n=1 Tax=Stenotrophomonas maltophilia TaxID=40324 RepID=UPI000C14DA57|nr:P-loop NTPase fold protein [Stenotrophomonas maltophilia]MDW7599960.1 P-loop NTPase fold protein [Stenotrophomonas maltophilia]